MTLRISTPAVEEGGRRDGDMPAVSADYYMARLVKLIPGEAIVVYPFLNSRAKEVADEVRWGPRGQTASAADPASATDAAPLAEAASGLGVAPTADNLIVIAVAWLILLVVILLRWQATRVGDGPAQWGAVAIAAVSFTLWVPVMGGTFGILDTVQSYSGAVWPQAVQRFIPELLLVLWTVLVPAFYRPEN